MKRYLSVVNYERYQHYKQRNPKWVKLYLDLASDYAWRSLNDTQKSLLVVCYLVAARNQNRFLWDVKYIRDFGGLRAKRLDIQGLIDAGFLKVEEENASKVIAECKQDAITRREEKRREEKRRLLIHPKQPPKTLDKNPFAKCGVLEKAYPEIISWMQEAHTKLVVPKPGTSADKNWKATLCRLVTQDKYTEDEVIECLRWLFKEEEPRGADGFTWRQQCQSLAQLRNKNKGDVVTKFQKIYNCWKTQNGKQEGVYEGNAEFNF